MGHTQNDDAQSTIVNLVYYPIDPDAQPELASASGDLLSAPRPWSLLQALDLDYDPSACGGRQPFERLQD
jgi:hypothetical protein